MGGTSSLQYNDSSLWIWFHTTWALAGYLEDRLRKRTRRFTCNVRASGLFIMQQRLLGQMAFLGLQLWTSRKKQLRQLMVRQRRCPRRGPAVSDRLRSNPLGKFGNCRIYSGWGIKASDRIVPSQKDLIWWLNCKYHFMIMRNTSLWPAQITHPSEGYILSFFAGRF